MRKKCVRGYKKLNIKLSQRKLLDEKLFAKRLTLKVTVICNVAVGMAPLGDDLIESKI